jgi:hypothetical protein
LIEKGFPPDSDGKQSPSDTGRLVKRLMYDAVADPYCYSGSTVLKNKLIA